MPALAQLPFGGSATGLSVFALPETPRSLLGASLHSALLPVAGMGAKWVGPWATAPTQSQLSYKSLHSHQEEGT